MKCLILLALVAVASARTATPANCKVTCDSASTSPCAYAATGKTIAVGTTVVVASSTNITCASGGVGTTYVSQTCNSTGTAIDQVCVLSSSATASSFTSQAALTNWLTANKIPYSSPGTHCNSQCSGSSASTTQCPSAYYNCSQCFTGGCSREDQETAERETGENTEAVQERETRAGTGIVLTVCNNIQTIASQTACFQAAVCSGLVLSTSTCTYSVNGALVNSTCPTCNSGSKKGLLGLLGLLGLIPLLLCLSLSCLLLLCLIRRKKTAAAVPFATFDPGLPPVAATYPPPVAATYPPLAPTCPVVY